MLDIAFHQNVRVTVVIVSDVLDSDHRPIVSKSFITLQIKIFRIWLKNLQTGSDFKVLPLIFCPLVSKLTRGYKLKTARYFTASIASSYGLATSKVTLSDLNSDLPALDRLLKHKQRLRKLWHETWYSPCKTAVNRVTKTNEKDDSEEGTSTVRNKSEKLWGYTSSYLADWEIPYEEGCTKDSKRYFLLFRP
jgi:hypothetical protein